VVDELLDAAKLSVTENRKVKRIFPQYFITAEPSPRLPSTPLERAAAALERQKNYPSPDWWAKVNDL